MYFRNAIKEGNIVFLLWWSNKMPQIVSYLFPIMEEAFSFGGYNLHFSTFCVQLLYRGEWVEWGIIPGVTQKFEAFFY